MTDLDKLLLQSRQITQHIRVLAEEHQTLRIKYHLLNEQHKPIDSSSDGRRSQEPSRQPFLLTKIATWRRLAMPQTQSQGWAKSC